MSLATDFPLIRHARVRGLRRWLPGIGFLSRYNRTLFSRDLVAGLVLTALLAPIGMGYAEATGLPAIYGLYATIIPLLAYAKWIVLAAEPVTDIDITAADVLTEIEEELQHAGIELCFAQMKGPVKDHLKRYGLFSKLGVENFFPTIGLAVDHYLLKNHVVWHDWEDDQNNDGIGA